MSQLIDQLAGKAIGLTNDQAFGSTAHADQPETSSKWVDQDKYIGKGSEYDITSLQYPTDLGTVESEFGQHRVVFFINVQGASQIKSTVNAAKVDVPQSRFSKVSGTNREEVLKTFDSAGNDNIINRITKPKKRLTSAISLYMPESIIKSYSVNWGEESSDNMMGGDTAAQVALGVVNGIKDLKNAFSDQAGGKVGGAVGGSIASKIIGNMPYVQKAASISPGNTKAEQLFRNVDFNTFTFDYRFAPRSEDEAKAVLGIIRMFRHHMLPEYLDKFQYLYLYPSEFEIRYYNGDVENEFLENHMTAVLTNMSINYNPNGQFTTFANGMPTHINIQLQFKELAVPTKETSPSDRMGA